jgi:proprotein convertase subtilisin/kexin type 5
MTGLDSGSITPTQKVYLTSLVLTIVKFLSNFLKVVPTPGNNIFLNGGITTCIDINVPVNDMSTGIPNSDLHLYVIYGNDSTSS